MNLFDGSENYVLQSFKALSSDSIKDGVFDLPLLSVTLSKARDVTSELSKEENTTPSSLFLEQEGHGVASSNDNLIKETIVMRIVGAGRFNIKTKASRQKTFELFKTIVLNTTYFNLEVIIVVDPALDNRSDKPSYTDRFLSFRTNFYSASFIHK